MSDVEGAISYIFTWETSHDERVCPQCGSLNGKEYHGQDLFQHTLTDPMFGPIWDLDVDRSLMHGGSGTCRCLIAVAVVIDWSQFKEFNKLSKRGLGVALYQRAPGSSIAGLREEVRQLKGEVEDTEVKMTSLLTLIQGLLALTERMGLPPEVEAQIHTLIKLIRYIQMTKIAWASLTATTPIGMLMAIPTLATILGMGLYDVDDAIRGNMQ